MVQSSSAKAIISEIDREETKLGDLKKRAKGIRKDHDLALELWASGKLFPRLLATLIFDKKLLTDESIDQLAVGMLDHEEKERNQLSDWLLANQLMKDRRLVSMMETWEHNSSSVLRRLFWYHQARLRWTGQVPPANTEHLLDSLERNIENEEPEVQWAMNFCAGQIGIHDPKYRSRCIRLGERTGLYQDEIVPRNCTPNYLPDFIRIEAAKREG